MAVDRKRWPNPDGKGTTHPGCLTCGGYGQVLIESSDSGEQWDICPALDKQGGVS